MKYKSNDRRPISARNSRFSQRTAAFLVQRGVSPNTISGVSILFGIGAGLSLAAISNSSMARLWWALTAVFILLRLLANMLDGMVAIEAGKASAIGELYNEVPDRISDVAIFIGAGFTAGSSPHLGYIAAILALFIAYLRALGNQMGVTQLFLGPMGKSHRMFTLVAICLYSALTPTLWQPSALVEWGLLVIIAGSVVTIIRRLQRIVVKVNA
jgi:phosphatidylglycerophosphate synthase